MKKFDFFFSEDSVLKSIEVYSYAHEGVLFILEGNAVYVITLTFCHLLIDSPVTRQKGWHGNKQRAVKTMTPRESYGASIGRLFQIRRPCADYLTDGHSRVIDMRWKGLTFRQDLCLLFEFKQQLAFRRATCYLRRKLKNRPTVE